MRKKPRDDDEPLDLSSSSTIEEKNVENNNEPKGSLSFSTARKKKQGQQRIGIPTHHCHMQLRNKTKGLVIFCN